LGSPVPRKKFPSPIATEGSAGEIRVPAIILIALITKKEMVESRLGRKRVVLKKKKKIKKELRLEVTMDVHLHDNTV